MVEERPARGAAIVASMVDAGSVDFEPDSGEVRHLTVREADEAETADARARVSVTNYKVTRDGELLAAAETEVHVLAARDDEFPDVPLALVLSPDGGAGRAFPYAHGQKTPSAQLHDLDPVLPMTLPWGTDVIHARRAFKVLSWGSKTVKQGEWLAFLIPLAP